MADKGTATMQVDEPLKPGIQKLFLSEDATDLAQDIANLSPTTKQNLGILLRSISKGEALIDTDKDGRAQIKYTQSGKHKWDASNANVIAQPKSDQDKKEKVDACLELIGYLKTEKPPSGVLLDPLKISLSRNKEYRLGFEYEETGSILGRGNSAGDIVVVKDKGTEQEHGIKTIMISCFRKEEVLCWVDMSDTGYVPALYLFKIDNRRVTLHMEILNNAKTVHNILNEQMKVFFQDENSKSLLKALSLLVLDGALEAITVLHDKGWVHQDLHGGNVMVLKISHDKLGVKILDFGNANLLKDCTGLNIRYILQKDICEVLRLFSGLYTGLEFENVQDIQNNWKKMYEILEVMKMSEEDRLELFYSLGEAMKIDHPSDVRRYRELVKKILNKVMGDANTEKEIHQGIVALLFPEDFKPVHIADNTSLTDKGLRKSDFQTSASKPSSQLNLSRSILPVSNNASNSKDDSQQDECNVFGANSMLRPDEPTSKENALELRVQLVNAQPTAAPRSSSALQMSAPLSARSKLPEHGSLSQNTEPLSTALQRSATLSARSKLPGHGSLSQNTEPLSTALQRSAALSARSKLPGHGSLSQNTEPLSTAQQRSAPLSAWSKLPGHGSLSQNTEPLSMALQRSAPLSARSKLPGQGSLSQNTEPLSTQSPVERFPTQHQSQLMDIQHNTEQLLKKKSMLDKEEQYAYQLEKEDPKMWDHKDAKKEEPSLAATKQDFTDKLFSKNENSTTKDCKKTVSMTQDRDSTSISENTSTSTAHDESQYISIMEHKGGMSGELPGGAAQTK